MKINIEAIELDLINYHSYNNKFNTCNHWIDNIRPQNYYQIIAQTNASSWIDIFSKDYNVIDIDQNNTRWLREAAAIGMFSNKISHIFDDESEEFIVKYSKFNRLLEQMKPFVRCENVSLKEGKHGCGPYTSMKEIMESLCTCRQKHSPFSDEIKTLKLYLIPWVTIDSDREF